LCDHKQRPWTKVREMPDRFKDQMIKGFGPGEVDAIRMAISVRDSADAEIKQLKHKSHVARAESASLRASLKMKGTDYLPLTDKDCANIARWAMQADEKPRKMTPEELAECESAYMRFVQNEDPPDGLFLAYHHPSYIEHIRIVERERDEAVAALKAAMGPRVGPYTVTMPEGRVIKSVGFYSTPEVATILQNLAERE